MARRGGRRPPPKARGRNGASFSLVLLGRFVGFGVGWGFLLPFSLGLGFERFGPGVSHDLIRPEFSSRGVSLYCARDPSPRFPAPVESAISDQQFRPFRGFALVLSIHPLVQGIDLTLLLANPLLFLLVLVFFPAGLLLLRRRCKCWRLIPSRFPSQCCSCYFVHFLEASQRESEFNSCPIPPAAFGCCFGVFCPTSSMFFASD